MTAGVWWRAELYGALGLIFTYGLWRRRRDGKLLVRSF
jgi:hypothetical protein